MQLTPGLQLREVVVADAVAINRIYNHYVQDSVITFDIEPWSVERREEWIKEFANDSPYYAIVAELDDEIVGFTYNSPFRAKAGYRFSTETTIYIDQHNQARGVGTALYQHLFDRIAEAEAETELHRAIAVIALPNLRSTQFHQRFGFNQIGELSEVGYKLDRYVDVAWFEKKLT